MISKKNITVLSIVALLSISTVQHGFALSNSDPSDSVSIEHCAPMEFSPLGSLYDATSSDDFPKVVNHEPQCGARVPSHLLLAGYSNRINIELFRTKVPGKSVRWREDKKKYMIDKDRDGHKGSCWKLLDRNGVRIASINCLGYVVGK